MKEQHFGATRFKQIFNRSHCSTYGALQPWPVGDRAIDGLIDHGFIADRACVWDKRLNDHEIAIVARTYCSDAKIDNPPEGLRCVRLHRSVLGCDQGTAIAVVITSQTEASEALLSSCVHMPSDMLAYVIPLFMTREGYCIALQTGKRVNSPVVRIVKIERGA